MRDHVPNVPDSLWAKASDVLPRHVVMGNPGHTDEFARENFTVVGVDPASGPDVTVTVEQVGDGLFRIAGEVNTEAQFWRELEATRSNRVRIVTVPEQVFLDRRSSLFIRSTRKRRELFGRAGRRHRRPVRWYQIILDGRKYQSLHKCRVR